MKTDRSGRNLEEYRQLFWDEQKRVKELDGFITEYQKRELNFLERIAALVDERVDFCAALSGQTDRAVIAEATIKRVEALLDKWAKDEIPFMDSEDSQHDGWSCAQELAAALGEAK